MLLNEIADLGDYYRRAYRLFKKDIYNILSAARSDIKNDSNENLKIVYRHLLEQQERNEYGWNDFDKKVVENLLLIISDLMDRNDIKDKDGNVVFTPEDFAKGRVSLQDIWEFVVMEIEA